MKYIKSIDELRELITNFGNPVIYYDNDADGLCSFLLLRRYLGKGAGIAVRSYPELHESYLKKAEKLGADCVIVLDKPLLSDAFVNRAKEMNASLIWIDHHDMGVEYDYEHLYVYNEAKSRSARPVSNVIYDLTKGEEWLALIGCISDCFIPEFFNKVKKKYPEMFSKSEKDAFGILYGTEFGNIVRALNYGLKDSISNVNSMQNFLLQCKNPAEILEETEKNEKLRERFNELKKKQEAFVFEAEKEISGNVIFYIYQGDTSMSSDIANELSYRNKGKYIIVGYSKGETINLSIRGKNVRFILENILKKIEHASGGGHEDAVGAKIMKKDLEVFKKLIEKEIGK